jgi:D-tyrosyl-tRNA(Tyr) deacylase
VRAVIQRVSKASVIIDNHTLSQIELGFLILLGVEINDTKEDALWLAQKISKLRLFADHNDNMNRSIIEIKGDILVVSQFTLHAKTKKGNRPSYIKAATSENAILLYKKFIAFLEEIIQKKVMMGKFGANMKIKSVNDGPVTILIDTKNKE